MQSDFEIERMVPLIRHYIKAEYTTEPDNHSATLLYNNLAYDYIEEIIYEGSHGPLPELINKSFSTVKEQFAQVALSYKSTNSKTHKYDFSLSMDFSQLNNSYSGRDILKKEVLIYSEKYVSPEDRKKYSEKGSLLRYFEAKFSTNFENDLLKALDLSDSHPEPKESEKIKKTYVKNLKNALINNNFVPALMKSEGCFECDTLFIKDLSLYGGYLYDALEYIIDETELNSPPTKFLQLDYVR